MLGQFVRAALLTKSPRSLLGSRVGGAVRVGRGCSIIGSRLFGQVTAGDGTHFYQVNVSGPVNIGHHTYLSGPRIDIIAHLNAISIGSFCSIARGVQIQEYNHATNGLSTAFLSRRIAPNLGLSPDEISSKGPITIGHDVWIGANCIIVSGITIGTGAVVAAGSVVTKDVPAYAIVAGNPARILRYRIESAGLRQELLASEWWTWPLERIEAYAKKFLSRAHVD